MEKNKKYSGDWTELIDVCWEDLDNWDNKWSEFWREVEAYATEHSLTTRHVEEEFIIDGEFLPVPLEYEN